MAERQFARLNEYGVSSPLEDVHAYMRGEGSIRSPQSYFDNKGAAKDFDEMLARLLTESQYRDVAAGWVHGEDTDESRRRRKDLAKSIFAQDTDRAAAYSLSANPYPTYVDPPIAGKSFDYRR